jgi:hypothetical protein
MSSPQKFQEYAGKWIALLGRSDTVIAADQDLDRLPALVAEHGVRFSDVEVMRIETEGEPLITHGSDIEIG